MKKLIPLCLILLCLGGCYDYSEINDMAIVSGLFLEPGTVGDSYKLTAEIVNMSGDKNAAPRPLYIYHDGISMADAIDKATSISGKPLYFGHTQVLALDYDLAQQGVTSMMDYVVRQNNMRLSILPIVVKDSDTQALFSQREENQSVLSFQLAQMIETESKRGIIPTVPLYTFIQGTYQVSHDAYLPMITLDKDKPIFLGLAVFREGRLIGELSPDKSKTLLLALNKGRRGTYLLRRNGDIRGDLSFDIAQRNCTISPAIKDDKLTINIDFKGKFIISEVSGLQRINSDGARKELEAIVSGSVRQSLLDLVETLRVNNDFDLLGLQRKLRQNDRDIGHYLLANWENLYKNAQLTVTAQCEITSNGRAHSRLQKEES